MKGLAKIQASAMQFAVLISALVVLLLAGFLLLTHTQAQFQDQSLMVFTSIANSNKGISTGMNSSIGIRDSLLIEKELNTTTIRKSFWGAFEKITAHAETQGKEFTKQALVGHRITDRPLAVSIGSWVAPLVLAGDAFLKGDAKVSDKGIKPGIINGDYFNGTQLVYGMVYKSGGALPQLDPEWRAYTESVLQFVPGATDRVVEPQLKVMGSFMEPFQTIYSDGRMVIAEEYIGNIMIKSESEIFVRSQAKLTDVLLVAPKISFEAGFTGRVHCVASEQIAMGERVHLQYPSSVVFQPKFESEENSEENIIPVLIPDHAMVEGAVIYLHDNNEEQSQTQRTKVQLKIDSKAVCKAMIYCEGNLELKGTVYGTVFTKQFVANEGGSMYMNHLYNGGVDATQLPPEFGGLPLLNSEKSVVKWLY